jgi:hypothetical protein
MVLYIYSVWSTAARRGTLPIPPPPPETAGSGTGMVIIRQAKRLRPARTVFERKHSYQCLKTKCSRKYFDLRGSKWAIQNTIRGKFIVYTAPE